MNYAFLRDSCDNLVNSFWIIVNIHDWLDLKNLVYIIRFCSMSDKPEKIEIKAEAKTAVMTEVKAPVVAEKKAPVKVKKQWKNPALRRLGIPRWSLPSRNWMIFWTVLGSIGGGIAYDKYEQSQIRKKYMSLVEHLGEEKYTIDRIPRKLTIYIAPPPNDLLDSSLKLFKKFVKPVFNSAAIDFDMFSETRQGDIRAHVAQKIRDMRKEEIRKQQKLIEDAELERYNKSWTKFFKKDLPNLFKRKQSEPEVLKARNELYQPKDVLGLMKITKPIEPESDDSIDPLSAGGVVCIGRGAYKEYMNGVHEGLLGPLEKPQFLIDEENQIAAEKEQARLDAIALAEAEGKEPEPEPKVDENKPKPVVKPFIRTEDYPNAELAPEFNMNQIVMTDDKIPAIFEQPLYVYPVPNLIGFTKIPWKIYRYYTKRWLAEDFGERALNVIENKSRPFSPEDVFQAEEEELDWPKGWVKNAKEKNSEWIQEFVVDGRITNRMRVFEVEKDQ